MFRRVFLLALTLVAACRSGNGGTADRPGRLRIERTAPRAAVLLDQSAVARFCALDSTLSIVAVGEDWSAAVALRSAWPLVATSFPVTSPLGDAGSGAVAARPLTDTTESAIIAGSGTITVTPGDMLAGRLAVDVTPDSGAVIHLDGRFEELTVRMDGCP